MSARERPSRQCNGIELAIEENLTCDFPLQTLSFRCAHSHERCRPLFSYAFGSDALVRGRAYLGPQP